MLEISSISKTNSNPPLPSELLKVMPLGDSLTEGGYNENRIWKIGPGYREYLWNKLKMASLNVVFVGSMDTGSFGIDKPRHEGHSGWTIDQINENIESWIQASSPNLILLMIGTNDVLKNIKLKSINQRYLRLLAKIMKVAPTVKVIIASPIKTNNDLLNLKLKKIHDSLILIVEELKRRQMNIEFVDMYYKSGIENSSTDLIDGVHPTKIGYEKMGESWFQSIIKSYSKLFKKR